MGADHPWLNVPSRLVYPQSSEGLSPEDVVRLVHAASSARQSMPGDDVLRHGVLAGAAARRRVDLQRSCQHGVALPAGLALSFAFGFGVRGFRARSLDEYRAALDSAMSGVGPVLIILVVLTAELIWVVTAWSGGQAMVTFTAVVVTVFSPGGDLAFHNVACVGRRRRIFRMRRYGGGVITVVPVLRRD